VDEIGKALNPRDHKVLIDKDGLAHLRRPAPSITEPPTAEEFDVCINWFYAAALMWAKNIVRDDRWPAKHREWDLKKQLLRMIEWDHKGRYGWDYDTRHLGRHARDWMDDDVLSDLDRCWPGWTPDEMRVALGVSIELFDRLMSRTAIHLAVEPFDSSAVRAEIDRILAQSR
jgi:aminoglycoside 6-adenylyltransferase